MCSVDQVIRILLVGAFLGALPGAALANIGTAWLKNRLGISTMEVRRADDAGDGQPDADPDDADEG